LEGRVGGVADGLVFLGWDRRIKQGGAKRGDPLGRQRIVGVPRPLQTSGAWGREMVEHRVHGMGSSYKGNDGGHCGRLKKKA